MDIKIIGKSKTPEYDAAESLARLFESSMPSYQRGAILIAAGFTCFGEKTKHIDLVVVGQFERGFPSNVVLAGSKTKVFFHNFCFTIEVKDHAPQDIRFQGFRAEVLYRGVWSDATDQSKKQTFALANFLRDTVNWNPFVCNFLWFRNLTMPDLDAALRNLIAPAQHGNLHTQHNWLPSEFPLEFLLQLVCVAKPPFTQDHGDGNPTQRFYCAKNQTPQEVDRKITEAHALFTKIQQNLGRLTRDKLEKITKEAILKDQQYAQAIGKRLVVVKGRAGTGKTIKLIHIAYDLCKRQGERCLLLTYNKALVSDIRRTIALARVKSDLDAGAVQVESVHAFMRKLLVGFGIYKHDDEYDEATTDAVDTASRLFSEPSDEELALLKQMKEWAGRASAQLDSKAKELIRWLNDHLRPGKKWGTERVIVFTEYRATQNWLKTVLATEGFTGGDRLLTMYGGMDPHDRETVKAAYQTAPDISPVRILLATDAASEGLDLQNHCSRLIHYEIPWNPNRMEQRNGRIDRHGQKAAQVNVYHFVAQGYKDRERRNFAESVSDLEADPEFLMRVARKIETIREDLGKVGPVIAEQVEEAMLGRRTTLNTAQAERDAEPVRRMLKFERDLAKQIKALMEQYQETQKELRLSPDNIRKVVGVALELAGQPALVPVTLADRRTVYALPGLKGSWSACSDGLTHPHTQEVRPVVFDHASAQSKDDVVLVHLNHRLAQMSLRLLRAEVWNVGQRRGLKRITARIVPDHLLPTPAIVAHARLVVIGGDSQRLHEEVITAGGFIKEGKFSRMKVGEIEDALVAATDKEPSAKVKDTLLALYSKLASSLATALQGRTEDRTAGLKKEAGRAGE